METCIVIKHLQEVNNKKVVQKKSTSEADFVITHAEIIFLSL